MPDRHMSIVDAHVVLRRDGKILLLRRGANTYASGQLCLPSGIILNVGALPLVLAMHQRNPDGQARFGFFFEPQQWAGEPVNREPHKHTELIWASPRQLPPDTVDYAAKAITAIEHGSHFTINGWDST
jgi:8-oxo-dGTP diphosphatase